MKMVCVFAAGAVALLGTTVQAKDYMLQSAFPKNLAIVGETGDYFVKRVAEVTGGAVNFKHLGAGELSPPFEILDNVGSGAISAGWSYAAYASGKVPAAALFGSIPFGPDAIKYVSWVNHGGGLELWRKIYEPFNVVPMPCGVIISEAGGWYTKTIERVEDLKGLKIRIGGLGGKILAKLGASAQSIPAGEISTSLETGRLDATELSFPTVDRALGFYKVAKHYYFPGWHQPSGFIEFYMNKDQWNALAPKDRTAIDMACKDANTWAIGKAAGAQQEALDYFRAQGVEVARFPDAVIDALSNAADEVYAEESAKDPMFKQVIDSYRRYSRAYDDYQRLNAPK